MVSLIFLSLSSNSYCSMWGAISLQREEHDSGRVAEPLVSPRCKWPQPHQSLSGELMKSANRNQVFKWWLSQNYPKWCPEICFSQMFEPFWGPQRMRTNSRDDRTGNPAWRCCFAFRELRFIYTQMKGTFTPRTLQCFKSFSCPDCNAIWKWIHVALFSLLPFAQPLPVTVPGRGAETSVWSKPGRWDWEKSEKLDCKRGGGQSVCS